MVDGSRRLSRRTLLASGACGLGTLNVGCVGLDSQTDDQPTEFDVEQPVTDLDTPWGLAFLPDGSHLLITERDAGRLQLVDRRDWTMTPVEGVPAVHSGGQGGLLDVAVSTAEDGELFVFLTYSASVDSGGTTTHLARARLELSTPELIDRRLLFSAEPAMNSTQHYGSRVLALEDELFVTVGDRGDKTFDEPTAHVSQDRTNHLGSTIRLRPDGDVPSDNPFVDDPDVRSEVFSSGHRNSQGMTVHPETGDLWQSEHGERDGDEFNLITPGGNYGWPVTHHGCQYQTDEPVGDPPEEHDDIVNPVHYWECTSGGFPPAGMTFATDPPRSEWAGDLFVGNLAGEYLGRFTVNGESVEEQEPLLSDRNWRIRDVTQAPDEAALYVLIDATPAPLVRLVPDDTA